jgi:hypothetical protein
MLEEKLSLADAIRELRGQHKIFLKTTIQRLLASWSEHNNLARFNEDLEFLETFWNKHMSLATQVIAALQAQLAAALAAGSADTGAAAQLATLQAEGAIESPADLATIQAAAAALNISTGATNTPTGTVNTPGGTVATPVVPVVPAVPQVALTDSTGRTVYAFTGTPMPTTFTSAGVYTPTNTPIFLFSGDTAPGQQNGLSVAGASLIMVDG